MKALETIERLKKAVESTKDSVNRDVTDACFYAYTTGRTRGYNCQTSFDNLERLIADLEAEIKKLE